jgi:hypothetical protein
VTPELPILSRRRFPKYGLGTASFLLMGGAGSLLALRGSAPDPGGLRCLTAHEYRTLAKLADAVYPCGGPFELGAADLDLARDVDAFLADAAYWDRRDLKRALVLLEFGPVIFDRRLTTFSRLSEDDRREHFESWMTGTSDVRRQAATALRAILALRFYDRPQAWAAIGYEGPFVHVAST